MKAISIRQPWASLTAAGIRDIDISNRDTKYRGEILLVASSRRVGRDFGIDVPIDWYCRLRNAQALGVVPYDEEVPVSAIIGYAFLEDCCPTMQDSPWSAIGNNWIIRDAHILDSPIYGVKGKQGLFDISDITKESIRSSYEPLQLWSSYENGIFSVSMTVQEIEKQIPGWPIVLTICGDSITAPILVNNENSLTVKEVKQIKLVSPSMTVIKNVKEVQIHEDCIHGHQFKYLSFELIN